jgi:transcriptional regulator GlxA family with amidase domain
METRRIGILGFDGIQALDLVGPAETFSAAGRGEASDPLYDVVVLGLERKRFVSETGLTLVADAPASASPRLDTIIVPGGAAMRSEETARRAAAFVAHHHGSARRIASVCTGAYGLAPTGLLDGRHVATHWRYAGDLQRRYPALRVDADAIFVKDGPFYSSAGISAGIDLSLALIEEDAGPRAALDVARELVVFLKRPGGQAQFSEPLRFQTRSADRFSDLVAWMTGHLDADLSVHSMAAKVFLSPRQFTRAFRATYGKTPAAFVEAMRLAEASRRLSSGRIGIESIARSVGYASADVFRRAFERRFGVAPRDYRARFAAQRRSRLASEAS